MNDAKEIVSMVGAASAVLTVLIPVILYVSLLIWWKAKNRIVYAARFSMWPAILLSYTLGGPVARAIFGIESNYAMSFTQTLKGLVLLDVAGFIIFFPFGWWIAKKKYRNDLNEETS